MKLREKTNLEISDDNHLINAIMTNVIEEKNSKNKIRATSQLIAKAVIATLGPYGSSTIIQDREKHHFATKDGYDLMNRMDFDDPVARTILDLFRSTASNQVFTVGDGSTSAIVVANALYQALTDPENIEHFSKIAPKDIVDILNDLSEMIENELKKYAKPISPDMHELDIIASVANNNDFHVGKLIGDIYRKIGEYGFITMDVIDKKETDEYEIKSGIEWDRGYVDPVFGKMNGDEKIIYDQNPRVIVSNSNLTYNDLQFGLMPMIKEALNEENAQLLIIANDYDEDVLNFLKTNRTKHLQIGSRQVPMDFTAVDIDQVTKESRQKLEDIAMICGCRIYDKMFVSQAEVVGKTKEFIGHAGKIVITPKMTQLVKSDNLSEETTKSIKKKVIEIDDALKKINNKSEITAEDERELYSLRSRKSRLTSSTALFHVAGKTLTERMGRQRLIEDAIFACKSALKFGYIPGGNLCIPKILLEKKEAFASVLGVKYSYLPFESIRSFFAYFINMLADAFLESYRAVLNNSYMDEETVEETIKTCLNENKFYNLKLHKYEEWDKTAVINSVNTDIQILRSCISIIGILSTSNQFITLNINAFDQIRGTN